MGTNLDPKKAVKQAPEYHEKVYPHCHRRRRRRRLAPGIMQLEQQSGVGTEERVDKIEGHGAGGKGARPWDIDQRWTPVIWRGETISSYVAIDKCI